MSHGRTLVESGNCDKNWQKIILTVDSGAPDAVLPPHMLRWVDLVHTGKVGTEYEVANGEVVRSLGKKKCLMMIARNRRMSSTKCSES